MIACIRIQPTSTDTLPIDAFAIDAKFRMRWFSRGFPRYLPLFAKAGFERESAILIPHSTYGGLTVNLVFDFNRLLLGGGYVCSKGHEQLTGDVLLDSNARTRTLLTTAEHWINGQLRNASQFFDTTCNLTADLRSNEGLCSQTARRRRIRRRRFRSFAKRDEVDHIRRWQRWIRRVIRMQ